MVTRPTLEAPILQRAGTPQTATPRPLEPTTIVSPDLTPVPEPEPDPEPEPEPEDILPNPEAVHAQLLAEVEKLPGVVSADLLDLGATGAEIWVYWEVSVSPDNNTDTLAEAIRQVSFNLLGNAVPINFVTALNDGQTVPISYTWDNASQTWHRQELVSWLTATALATTGE